MSAKKSTSSAVIPEEDVLNKFRAFCKGFSKLGQKVSDLVPAYRLVLTQFVDREVNGRIMRILDFVRLVDPTCPEHRNEKDGVPGYRHHQSYKAIEYIGRVSRQMASEAEAVEYRQELAIKAEAEGITLAEAEKVDKAKRKALDPVKTIDVLADMVASLANPKGFLDSMEQKYRWTEKQVKVLCSKVSERVQKAKAA